ncbi:MAG: hypothetical protein J6X18_13670 [Bacteroidales bacterium]|nr:hypothetical protein [Bacteroidales bacterium]
MEKVYVLKAELENGRKFEAVNGICVFANEEDALKELQIEISDWITSFECYYDREDIRVDKCSETCVVIDGNNYDDCITLSVSEEIVH